VTYTVTVANGTDTRLSYSLIDRLGYPAGVTVASTSISRVHSALGGSGASVPQPVPSGTGPAITLDTGRLLPARSKDSYTVVVGATVSAGLSADNAACTGGPGHGWFNSAGMSSGSHTSNARGCAAITLTPAPPPPVAPAGPPPPTLPVATSGAPMEQDLLLASVLLGSGALLLLLAWRLRRRY
jgi:hypothetical protein